MGYACGEPLDCGLDINFNALNDEVRASAHRLRHELFRSVFDRGVSRRDARGAVGVVPRQWSSKGTRAYPDYAWLLHSADAFGVAAATSTAEENHVDQSAFGLDRCWLGDCDGDEFRVDTYA